MSKNYSFSMDTQIDDDIERSISFISDKILSYYCSGNTIILECDDSTDDDEIQKVIEVFRNRKKQTEGEIIYDSENERNYFSEHEIVSGEILSKYYDGSIALSGVGIKLFDFFDQYLSSILNDLPVIYKKYPASIEMSTLIDTGYLANSPHHSMFCYDIKESLGDYAKVIDAANNNNLKNYLGDTKYALSPSACFSLYKELRNASLEGNSIFSFIQNVFRNEGRFNWKELHRLRDYNVREIVFIGDKDYVNETREILLKRVIEKVEALGLSFNVEVASDPFILPTLQSYRFIQKKFKVKYEFKVNISKEKSIACASFNLHGTTFANRFHFSKNGSNFTESGCIGFGIERWVIAFLHQYGLETKNWPEIVQNYINKK